ncbi:heme utilization radical SAM enzyme HutW [Ursidibacter arcticus]|nr:heme anaerobic degradation radical SAM methyltransferase ChuW/HutW [Ursidibacter arcticus]KAE9531749.1 heme utilization radical SAM enzyme HutW [Ursidibacter arcticus]
MITTQQWHPSQAAPTAFTDRKSLMPIWGGQNIPENEWLSLWNEKVPYSLTQDALAYLHIPFCAGHCVFCGFYRNAWKESYSQIYTDKLISELANEAQLRRQSQGKIQAVYFGGGTPTALATEDLVRLIRACYQYLPLADDCEFTLEGRISHFDLEKAQACIDAGVNRISIGIQTFNSALRKRMGRKHSGEEAYTYLQQLCDLNAVIVADLIFGFPNQTDEVWANDIATASTLALSGLDIYAFNCYPFLPINRLIQKGTLPPPQPFAVQSQHYAYAVQQLLAKGWLQVSNNHFAYPDRRERNRYNTLVKSDISCLAFGSGAGGNFGGMSYQVQGDLQRYLETPSEQKALSFMSQHGQHKKLLSQTQYSLELGFLEPSLFADNPQAQDLLLEWQKQSLLRIEADKIYLNTSGRYWSPTLVRQLMMTLPND